MRKLEVERIHWEIGQKEVLELGYRGFDEIHFRGKRKRREEKEERTEERREEGEEGEDVKEEEEGIRRKEGRGRGERRRRRLWGLLTQKQRWICHLGGLDGSLF